MAQSKEQSDVDIAQLKKQHGVDIALTGDIILAVGKDDDKMSLRVSSLFLKSTSKVFAAMFGPRFAEGQGLNESNPRTVPLPDDNPFAMRIICSELHLRTDLVPDELTTSEFYSIACLVNKYDCHIALKRLFQVWMMNTESTTDPNTLALHMVSAYIFDDATAFERITHDLIVHYDMPYIKLWEDVVSCFVPWKALGN
ncbi:hypothetical protein EV356DRAFT_534331 [Viridothelium virens]|uniref:BTB domain-containing protein n=1 Tax=Viridothelium virens TaxID=1048519 RepID=A0A6A6H4M0_VIRVR|nr:hypothetical protein EV356DRAFT_534331 [Viridothelium virens]